MFAALSPVLWPKSRAHATNGQRYFEIAAISAKTGRLLTSTTSMTDGGDRPNSFTYDVASTVWAD